MGSGNVSGSTDAGYQYQLVPVPSDESLASLSKKEQSAESLMQQHEITNETGKTYPPSTLTKMNSAQDHWTSMLHSLAEITPNPLLSERKLMNIAQGIAFIATAVLSLITKVYNAVKDLFHFLFLSKTEMPDIQQKTEIPEMDDIPQIPQKTEIPEIHDVQQNTEILETTDILQNTEITGIQLIKELLTKEDVHQVGQDIERQAIRLNGKRCETPKDFEDLKKAIGSGAMSLLVQTLATDITIARTDKNWDPLKDWTTNFGTTQFDVITTSPNSVTIKAQFPLWHVTMNDDDELGADLICTEFTHHNREINISTADLDGQKPKALDEVNKLLSQAEEERIIHGEASEDTKNQLREKLDDFAPSLTVRDTHHRMTAKETFGHLDQSKYALDEANNRILQVG